MELIRKAGFFSAFILGALSIQGFYGGGFRLYMPMIFAFVILPVFDQLIGLDKKNVPPSRTAWVAEEFYYRFVTYLWTYFQVGFLFWGAYAISRGTLTLWWEWLAFAIGFSLITGGIGITVAHELGHKKSRIERLYSKVLLITVCYMHFYIEHNRGHHVYVATPEDPATARKNENFYRFWVRSVFGGYANAWKHERERLHRRQRPVWSVHNQMIWFAVLPVLFCALLTFTFSPTGAINWQIPLFFFVQSFFAFTLLELVNYVEHYGIVRRRLPDGRYERVNPLHSWNASHMLSNFFLFQLQRHSDHHAHAIKRYQVLDHYDESPQLPFGYPTMIMLALVPPAWFRFMNPRLAAWEQQVYREPAPAGRAGVSAGAD
jgi:alkane 1-monooxygenase